MATEGTRVYEQISSKAYEHPADKAATSALHAVPLLDTVVKRLTDLGLVDARAGQGTFAAAAHSTSTRSRTSTWSATPPSTR